MWNADEQSPAGSHDVSAVASVVDTTRKLRQSLLSLARQWVQEDFKVVVATVEDSVTAEAASEEAVEVAGSAEEASTAVVVAGAEWATVARLPDHVMVTEVGMAVVEGMTAALVVDAADATTQTSNHCLPEVVEADTAIVTATAVAETRTTQAKRDLMMAVGMMIRDSSGGGTRLRCRCRA